jgi:hypothetical protein
MGSQGGASAHNEPHPAAKRVTGEAGVKEGQGGLWYLLVQIRLLLSEKELEHSKFRTPDTKQKQIMCTADASATM